MKNKKTKLGIAGLIFLAGCSTFKPGGSIDIAYVPNRCDDKMMTNELKVGLEGYVDTNLKEMKLRTGGNAVTYMNFPKDETIIGGFDPTRISYDFFSELTYKNIMFYLFHNCTHPIKDKEYWVGEEGNRFYVNHDSKTEFGVKWEF